MRFYSLIILSLCICVIYPLQGEEVESEDELNLLWEYFNDGPLVGHYDFTRWQGVSGDGGNISLEQLDRDSRQARSFGMLFQTDSGEGSFGIAGSSALSQVSRRGRRSAPVIEPAEEIYYASSNAGGASSIGDLISSTFIVSKNFICLKVSGNPCGFGNRVAIDIGPDGNDDLIMSGVNENTEWQDYYFDLSPYKGKSTALHVVDGMHDNQHGWIAVDAVEEINNRGDNGMPPSGMLNADFENGNLSGWSVKGNGFAGLYSRVLTPSFHHTKVSFDWQPVSEEVNRNSQGDFSIFFVRNTGGGGYNSGPVNFPAPERGLQVQFQVKENKYVMRIIQFSNYEGKIIYSGTPIQFEEQNRLERALPAGIRTTIEISPQRIEVSQDEKLIASAAHTVIDFYNITAMHATGNGLNFLMNDFRLYDTLPAEFSFMIIPGDKVAHAMKFSMMIYKHCQLPENSVISDYTGSTTYWPG